MAKRNYKAAAGRVTAAAKGVGSDIRERVAPLVFRKIRIGSLNIPVVFFLVAVLSILPIGMVFGEESSEPVGRNLADPANPLVEILNVNFYSGTPADAEKIPLENLEYPDGTKIQNGNFWLSFDWRLLDNTGTVEFGDYFDVVLDLGLAEIAAEVEQQVGTFAPVIITANGTTAGTIKWINQSEYQSQQRIVIRIELNDPGFRGLSGDGTDEGGVRGTGVWGFKYKAGEGAIGDGTIVWQIENADGYPVGAIRVDPEPPEGDDNSQVSDAKQNPYYEFEKGYKKFGTRLTPEDTPLSDTIFYWSVSINGHKHKTITEWQNCPNNTDNNPYNDDPPLPVDENGDLKETFTIIDEGRYISPTWLRNVTEVSGKPVIHTGTPLMIERGGGLYGRTVGETAGPAYVKLFYVNSEYIWNSRINYAGSNYMTPANDPNKNHHPSPGNPVGIYDPYYTNAYLKKLEADSVLYMPNYSETGGKYGGYLTPVPPSDIRSITMKQNGYEIEMISEKVLGKTLVIAYMTKPATDENGLFHTDVGNTVSIKDVNDGNPVAGASGQVLIGGTISGRSLVSPNRGSFVIEKYDLNTAQPMPGVVFNVVASCEDQELADAANELIAGQLVTGPGGKLSIELPPLPWPGGKLLTLTVTEVRPEGYVGLQPFTVRMEPENGTVVSIDVASGDRRLVQIAADQYGVYAWNRSSVKDTSYYDVALRKWIKKVDREVDGVTWNVYYNEDPNTEIVAVKDGDRILFRIDLYNQCFNKVFVTGISDWLPKGLKFDKTATIAHIDPAKAPYNNDLWELVSTAPGEPEKLRYIGPPIPVPIEPMTDAASPYPEHRIPLVLVVDMPEVPEGGLMLTNVARITGLQNANGEDVEDIDSFIEDDRDSAGPVPGIDYETPPDGIVIDNDIEGHRKDVDGEKDLSEDEDTHDYASVIVWDPIIISCEVDKDTIRRTSAAFDGLPGSNGYKNVGNELYRYDIDFRSTSSLPADEFVVTDPLENVAGGQVRIEGLWLPAVWGDEDGKMNVWYKSKNVPVNKETIPEYALAVTKVLQGERYIPINPAEGWRLWAYIDKSDTEKFKTEGVIERENLGLPADLADDDYITAICFEYGAVKVGFTSKNYESYSLNGEHRDADGQLTLPQAELSKISNTFAVKPAQVNSVNVSPASATSAEVPEGNFFTKLFATFFGTGEEADTTAATPVSTTAEAFGIGGPGDEYITPSNSSIVDWTPNPMYPDYSIGAKNATELMPASYLVKAVKPMENESIVSSATSQIARQGLYDASVDAVVTYQLPTFILEDGTVRTYKKDGTYEDRVPRLDPNSETGASGRSSRTYDDMNIVFWVGMAFLSLTAAFFVLLVWNRRKRLLLALASLDKRRRRSK